MSIQVRCAVAVRFAVALFGLAAVVCAQDRGTITGTITDPGNANVPDAQVTVKNSATGWTQTVKTGADGIYSVPYLPVGSYLVEVDKTGFRRATASDVQVQVNTTVRLNVTLALGSVD